MNLTDLHYVVEIDKSGSISKAAKELYVAQPNLSKAIKHLEREFGISIFERSSKGVKATREGQKFLEYAKRIIYEIEEMKRDCSEDYCSEGKLHFQCICRVYRNAEQGNGDQSRISGKQFYACH